MALKTKVKVQVSNLSDARYCAGMGVDLIGFDLDETGIDPTDYIAITQWLEGPEYVARFEKSTIEQIKTKQKDLEFDYIQSSKANLIDSIEANTILTIPCHHIDSDLVATIDRISSSPKYILLESDRTGDLMPEEIENLLLISKNHETLLGFGISVSNIDNVLEKTEIQGIALKGGEEIRPGFKNFDELADILEKLETED